MTCGPIQQRVPAVIPASSADPESQDKEQVLSPALRTRVGKDEITWHLAAEKLACKKHGRSCEGFISLFAIDSHRTVSTPVQERKQKTHKDSSQSRFVLGCLRDSLESFDFF